MAQDKIMVSVKVLRNDKDCIDQGLGEVTLYYDDTIL